MFNNRNLKDAKPKVDVVLKELDSFFKTYHTLHKEEKDYIDLSRLTAPYEFSVAVLGYLGAVGSALDQITKDLSTDEDLRDIQMRKIKMYLESVSDVDIPDAIKLLLDFLEHEKSNLAETQHENLRKDMKVLLELDDEVKVCKASFR